VPDVIEIAKYQHDAIWKVYVQDWTIAYSSDARGEDGKAECQRVLEERWNGRVELEDVFIRTVGSHHPPYCIWLRLPQLQGEWKSRERAEAQAREITGTLRQYPPLEGGEGLRLPGLPEIVVSGSAEERVLLDYGKRMLPA
jgi:hypothetical protein